MMLGRGKGGGEAKTRRLGEQTEKRLLKVDPQTNQRTPPPSLLLLPIRRFGDQFEEPGNYLAHSTGTGPEILSSMSGLVDLFCMSAGTGGMLSGVGNLILNLGGRVVAADVTGSVYGNWVEGGVAYCEQQRERGVRKHRYDTIAEGIGMDRITGNLGRLKRGVEEVRVEEQDIVDAAWWIFRKEGIR